MFQDGPIAQAAETFVQGGGVYCSAAGNFADQGVMMPFAPVVAGADDTQSNGVPNANDLHNWGLGGAAAYLPLVVPPGGTIARWSFSGISPTPPGAWDRGHRPTSTSTCRVPRA